MEEVKLRTLSVLVDNEAGVLSQVSRLFSRKGFNVESLAVGATDNPAISRMTIEVRPAEPDQPYVQPAGQDGPRPLGQAAQPQPFHPPRADPVQSAGQKQRRQE